jgi:diguanylate cyclase (GGDEF)-like protein
MNIQASAKSTATLRASIEPAWLLGGLLMVAAVAGLDSGTGDALSLAPLYTILIVMATWRAGGPTGVMLAVACALAWLLVDISVNAEHAGILTYGSNVAIRGAAYLALAVVIALLRRAIHLEWHNARVDYVTGIANVRQFYDDASTELRRAHRHHYPLTLVFLDVDDFKAINDRFGHRAGDRALRTVAAMLASEVRSSDVLARLGGDEFAVLMPHARCDAAHALLSRLKKSAAEHLHLEGIQVTFSAGVATFDSLPESVDEMLGTADRVMYSAKHGGKDRIACVCHRTDEVDVPSLQGVRTH